MVPESNESLEKLVLLIPKSLRITVTDIRAITGSITGPLIWRSLLGRGKGFITGMGGGQEGLGRGVARRNRASAAALKSRRQPTPLILCAHENLRELWRAAIVALTPVFENAFRRKPSLLPSLLRLTGIHARVARCIIRHSYTRAGGGQPREKRERDAERRVE